MATPVPPKRSWLHSGNEWLSDFRSTPPFVQTKTGATEVVVGAASLYAGKKFLNRRSARKAAMAPEGPLPSNKRRAISRVGGDVLRAPATFLYGAETAMGPPNPKTFPNARANVGKAANAPTPKAPTSTKRYGGGPSAREMTPAQKGQLRKKTNKAAAAAKPIMQKGLRARFAVPTPKETPAPKAAATPKVPAATTVEITPKPTPERAFQPGKLEGETRAQTTARHVAEHAADNAAKRAEKKKVEPKNKTKAPTSAKPPSPAAVEKVSAPRTSLTAAERKAAKDAKSAENRRVHAESQAREREARRAAKAAGGSAPSPSKPAGPKAPSGGFVSTFKPQVRTFDPMVGQKQIGRTKKPYNDSPEAHRALVKEGMMGRTGNDQRPTHTYDAKGRLVVGGGPYSPEGRVIATSPMFPGGTHDAPTSLQPHMTGKGAEVIGEQGNFRVWQGPRRSETVVEHRTGRQVSLPYNPNKQGDVNPKAILAYANEGNNEKAFLAGGFSADGKTVSGRLGKRNRTARFALGAAKAGGILALPITAISVLSGAADPLQAAGFQVDRAGEGNTWYAKAHPKKFSAEVKAAIKARATYQGRRAGSQFNGAASWADIARKYTAGKK